MSSGRRAKSAVLLLIALSLLTPGGNPSAQTSLSLHVSGRADRSAAVPLDGFAATGNLYVFVPAVSGIKRVDFYLDDPNRLGVPIKVEGMAPWDYAGTATNGSALPVLASSFGFGPHNITALVTRTSGAPVVISANFTVPDTPEQIHLGWVDDPSTTLNVIWRARDITASSRVDYRRAGDTSWTTSTGAPRSSGAAGILHEAQLTGLSPDTRYEYRVFGGRDTVSPVFSMRTAPLAGGADFDAVYVADLGIGGRADGLTAATPQVIQAIEQLQPDLILLGGNYAYSIKDSRFPTVNHAIDAWFAQMQVVGARAPMMPSYGNHEVVQGVSEWSSRFATPSGLDGGRNYSFDVGDAHFVSIFAADSNNGLPAATLAWLEGDLSAAKAAGKRWIVPFFHVSPFSDGHSHPANVALRAQLGPLFEQHGVKVALSAHDQSYERTYPLGGVPSAITRTSLARQCYGLSDGLTWVKASPGGKAISATGSFSRFLSEPPPFWTAVRNNTVHNFVRVRVGGASLKVEVYGLTGDFTPPTIIDSFEYTSGACPPELFFQPDRVRFTATQNLAAPAQTVLLKANGSTPAAFTVTQDAPWLTITPATGSTPQALTFSVDASSLPEGSHRTRVRATSPGYAASEVEVVLQKYPDNTTHQLLMSGSPTRLQPSVLAGAAVIGTMYVFASPDAELKRVHFYLDDPNMSGAPIRTENQAPWDFNGTHSDGTALPLDTGLLAQGPHTITALTEMTSGAVTVLSAPFIVERDRRLTFARAATTFNAAVESTPKTVSLSTSDGVAANVSVSDDAEWLSVEPALLTAPGELTLTFNATGLADGTYSALVTARAAGYPTVTHSVTLSVGSASYQLLISGSPDRSVPAPLAGSTVSGSIYAFMAPGTGVSEVRFFLDDPAMAASPMRVESIAPHDLGGGTAESALPYDTRLLTDGLHNLTAEVRLQAGGSIVLTADFRVSNSTGQTGGCAPLSCDQYLVAMPYGLDFGSDHGKITDRTGIGTGFTYVDRGANGGGYRPANLAVDLAAGTLSITTTSGSNSTTSNNLDNALGVGVDAPSQVTRVSTVLLNPPAGSGKFEQAGLWFGNDADNYVKLVVLSVGGGPVLEFSMEVNGAQTQKVQQSLSGLAGAAVVLALRADPRDRSISATYRVGAGPQNSGGTFTAPPEFFSFDGARIDPAIGTDTFTGVFATHRVATKALTYTFDQFVVEVDDTSPPPVDPAGFVKSTFAVQQPTSMVWGPDDRLYVTELFGEIHAFDFADSKVPTSHQVIDTIQDVMGGPRMTLGIAVDPLSTPTQVILWVAHSNGSMTAGEPNSGIVTRLSGPNFEVAEHVITGLPRAIANHGQNAMHFGPDGRLYMAIGGNTGAGGPNTGSSEFGDMKEQPLSAAILVADVHAPDFDGTCHNESDIFGPPPCDVTPYATGFRNTYDFVFHSNGSMYATDNGLGVEGTFPPSPTPPCLGLSNTAMWNAGGHNPGEQPDLLFRVAPGGYHGHPNPYRQECVFKNGMYQGVPPPPGYVAPIASLGMNLSANSIVEYKYASFFGSLKNELLVANYSLGDSITRLRLAPDGNSVANASTLVSGFDDPLPLALGPDGTIFVGEFGGDKITALDPRFGRWFVGKSMAFARHEVGSAAIDHHLYLVGGNVGSPEARKVEQYDTITDTWRTMADLPKALDHVGVAALNGKIYVFGGLEDFPSPVSKDVYEFDPAVAPSGRWTKISEMPEPVGGAAVGVHNGFVYIAGGFTGHHDASLTTNNVWRFEPVSRTWAQMANIPTYRDHMRGEFIGGRFYVVGGRQDGQLYGRLATLEMYDPATNAWATLQDMPTARRGIATAVLDGRLLVIGGEKNQGTATEVFEEVEEYDPVTNTWRNVAPMRTPRHTAGAAAINGRVYVAGGATIQGGSGLTNMMEVFTFANRK